MASMAFLMYFLYYFNNRRGTSLPPPTGVYAPPYQVCGVPRCPLPRPTRMNCAAMQAPGTKGWLRRIPFDCSEVRWWCHTPQMENNRVSSQHTELEKAPASSVKHGTLTRSTASIPLFTSYCSKRSAPFHPPYIETVALYKLYKVPLWGRVIRGPMAYLQLHLGLE